MLLAIDAGNTNITLGLFRGEELIAQWRLLTDRERTSDEYEADVRSMFERAGMDGKNVNGIAIASVVPQLDHALRQIAASFSVQPLFVDHTTDTGMKLLYHPPSDLGADRIADGVAAMNKYGTPCIVVDFGTATTFNAISKNNEFLGGAISPGLFTCSEALFQRAAKLPRVEFARPRVAIGSSTVEAMQSGIYYGYAGLVDGVIEQMLEGMSPVSRIVATGGLAPLIAEASQYIDAIDQTLTLDGLRIVYERNNRAR
ncbi:MAG TPA: type III pantothenate kinase [Pyrinomonadaceae bacterium]|nr:type III pantothenate kinase [Pyrinomonadaceae bacterium]